MNINGFEITMLNADTIKIDDTTWPGYQSVEAACQRLSPNDGIGWERFWNSHHKKRAAAESRALAKFAEHSRGY